jgi:hypothetical protein
MFQEKDEDRVYANTNNSEEDTDDDEEFKEVKDVFVFINEDCRVLLLDAFFEVLDADEMLRIKVIRSALKYFLQTDMVCTLSLYIYIYIYIYMNLCLSILYIY